MVDHSDCMEEQNALQMAAVVVLTGNGRRLKWKKGDVTLHHTHFSSGVYTSYVYIEAHDEAGREVAEKCKIVLEALGYRVTVDTTDTT